MKRRALLGLSAGAFVGVAGCSTSDQSDPPAGSLRFSNQDDLPHAIRLVVSGAGAERGEERGTVTGDPPGMVSQPSFTTTAVLEPKTEQVYEDVFTAPAYYAARHTVDNEEPENNPARIAFNPAPRDRERGGILEVTIKQDGVFGWVITYTSNLGPFA